MAILERVRYLLFILIFSVSIRVSKSCNNRNSHLHPLHNRFFSLQGYYNNDYFNRTCEKWDKPEDCSPRGMRYYQHPVKGCESLGFCDCYKGHRSKDPCKDFAIRKQIYIPEENRCYPIFSQGPCKEREWLIFNELESTWKCITNACFPRGSGSNKDFWFYDPRIGQCHQADTPGYCTNGKFLSASHYSLYPQCTTGYACVASGSSVIKSYLECRPGTRYSHFLRKCRGSSGVARVG